MKKSIILTLALVFVLGIAGTAFAANPFVDVPAKHWAYDAVAKLAQAGIVDGYGDGTFKGDKTMTRYEMAQIVAKAMARADKANAEQKAAIDKLSVEFSTELNNMGVRVAALEKKAAADRVNFTGLARVRFENNQMQDDSNNSNHRMSYKLQIDANAKINDDWTANMRWEAYNNFRDDKGFAPGTSNTVAQNGSYDITRAYVTGPIAGVQLTAGKYGEVIGAGIGFDDSLTGANVVFGNALKVKLAAVQTDSNIGGSEGAFANNTKVYYAQFNYNTSKVTSVEASYQQWKNTGTANAYSTSLTNAGYTGKDNINIWDVRVDTSFAKDWAFTAAYAKSNLDRDNRAWMAGVKYLQADANKVGSWDVFANWEDTQVGAGVGDTTNWVPAGTKGYVVGVHYAPAKNMMWTNVYYDAKANALNATTLTENQHKKYFRSQVEFFF